MCLSERFNSEKGYVVPPQPLPLAKIEIKCSNGVVLDANSFQSGILKGVCFSRLATSQRVVKYSVFGGVYFYVWHSERGIIFFI